MARRGNLSRKIIDRGRVHVRDYRLPRYLRYPGEQAEEESRYLRYLDPPRAQGITSTCLLDYAIRTDESTSLLCENEVTGLGV